MGHKSVLINPCNNKLDIIGLLLYIGKKKTEVKTDDVYLPKFTWLLSRIEISKWALALRRLLLKPHKSSGSFKRKYVRHCNFAIFHSCQGIPCLYMPQRVFLWEPRILINRRKLDQKIRTGYLFSRSLWEIKTMKFNIKGSVYLNTICSMYCALALAVPAGGEVQETQSDMCDLLYAKCFWIWDHTHGLWGGRCQLRSVDGTLRPRQETGLKLPFVSGDLIWTMSVQLLGLVSFSLMMGLLWGKLIPGDCVSLSAFPSHPPVSNFKEQPQNDNNYWWIHSGYAHPSGLWDQKMAKVTDSPSGV